MTDLQDFYLTIKPVREMTILPSALGRRSGAKETAGADILANINPHPDLHDEQLIIGESPDGPVCFAHVGTGVWADKACGYLRFLSAGDSHRTLIHATLERVEDVFRRQHIRQVRVGAPGYSYRLPCTEDGSIALLLLLQRGYKIVYGNVHYWMDRLEDCPRETPQDSSLRIESVPEAGNGQLPNGYIRLRRSGRQIGEAQCFSAWHDGPSEHTQQVFYVGDIDIVDEERNKGLGRYLLGEAIHEMGKLGYIQVSLSTGVGNLRARLLYTSMGFRQGPTEHILMKDLLHDQALGVSEVPIYGYPEGLKQVGN